MRCDSALTIKENNDAENNNNNSNNSKAEVFNKIKQLTLKKFSSHFHYYRSNDKHTPTPDEIKLQTNENNNIIPALPQQLLSVIDKSLENINATDSTKQDQQQQQQQSQQQQQQQQPLLDQQRQQVSHQAPPQQNIQQRPGATYYPPTSSNPQQQQQQQQQSNNNIWL